MTQATQIIPMQRSRGEARVALAAGPGAVRLTGLRQQGSAKVILPRVGGRPEVVFLNTSGGLTGGDALSYAVEIGAGVQAIATTQTAERAYRSAEGVARVRIGLSVGAGGFLDWLPQETILFDGAALDRRTTMALGPGAGCLMLEMVVLGRPALGEVVRRLFFRDWRMVEQGDQPVWVEPLFVDDAALATGPPVVGQARAFATLALIRAEAADLLSPLRQVLDEPGVRAAASALPGRLMLRAQAPDGWPLRRQIARALGVLRAGHPLPRVWQM